jgi:hypothetical protein
MGGWEGPAKKGIALRRGRDIEAMREDGRLIIVRENIC